MSWGSWGEFLSMGGYGFYVWGSYSVTFAALLVEMILLKKRSKQ
jgi:heme exporter protein D